MKVIVELEMDQLRQLEMLLRIPDAKLFKDTVHCSGNPSTPAIELAIRILKVRCLLNMSNRFDSIGNSPAINGIEPQTPPCS